QDLKGQEAGIYVRIFVEICTAGRSSAKAQSRILVVLLRRRAMRTYKVPVGIGLIGLALVIAPASGFDGTPTVDVPRGPALQSLGPGRMVAPPAAATMSPASAPAAGL